VIHVQRDDAGERQQQVDDRTAHHRVHVILQESTTVRLRQTAQRPQPHFIHVTAGGAGDQQMRQFMGQHAEQQHASGDGTVLNAVQTPGNGQRKHNKQKADPDPRGSQPAGGKGKSEDGVGCVHGADCNAPLRRCDTTVDEF